MCIILYIITLILEQSLTLNLKLTIPFFIISFVLVLSIIIKDDKKFYITIFIFGIIYEVMYFNTIILHAFIFILLGYLSKILLKNKYSFLKSILTNYLLIIIYFNIMFLFSSIISKSIYLKNYNILYSILLNSFYFSFVYFFFIYLKTRISNRRKKGTYKYTG